MLLKSVALKYVWQFTSWYGISITNPRLTCRRGTLSMSSNRISRTIFWAWQSVSPTLSVLIGRLFPWHIPRLLGQAWESL